MNENDASMDSYIIDYLVAHIQCTNCGQRFDTEDVRIYEHRGHVWLASMTCKHCGRRGLLVATLRTKSIAHAAEVSAQADMQEMTVLERKGPISSDEVLDFHRFLSDFRGDVSELLSGCSD